MARFSSSLSLTSLWFSCLSLANPIQRSIASNGTSSIDFGPCPSEGNFPSNVVCGQLSVPIDWNHPNGSQFNLTMVKIPTNGTNRIGNLFVNPGGPGGSAVSLAVAIALGESAAPAELFEAFDIIGVDPRGIGLSNPVLCDPQIWNERVSYFPTDNASYTKMVDHNKRLGASCRNRTGPLIDFVDTISVVKDHEAVRVALGNEKINWLGLSYGTQIGSQYAELYPENIRAMALDGILQHSQGEASNILIESTTYEKVLNHFFTWASNDTSGPLNRQNVSQIFISLLANATTTPIPALGCNNTLCRSDVTAEEIRFNTQGFLISPPRQWPELAQAILEASEGNATILSTPLSSDSDPSLFAGLAVECQDWSYSADTLGDLLNKEHEGAAFVPITQGASQSWSIQTNCIGFGSNVTNPPKALHVPKTPNPILLVNALSDPSTSYVWATGIVNEIESNVLLTRNGDGHTSFNLGGETSKATTQYLLDLTLPEPGTVLQT